MNMKPVSMRMSKSEKKRMFGEVAIGSNSGPDYPWGLSITLDSAALKKLGIDELPDAGEECMIHAIGKVTRVSETASEKHDERSIEIQITALTLVDQNDMEKKAFEAA